MLPSVPSLQRLCLVLREDANAALGLTGREAAAWVRDSASPSEETPRMRRMVRNLRQLDERHFDAVYAVVLALRRHSDEPRPAPEGEEATEARPLTV